MKYVVLVSATVLLCVFVGCDDTARRTAAWYMPGNWDKPYEQFWDEYYAHDKRLEDTDSVAPQYPRKPLVFRVFLAAGDSIYVQTAKGTAIIHAVGVK